MNKLILEEAINSVYARTARSGWGRFWSVSSECQGLHPPPPPPANYCILSRPHVSVDRWSNSLQFSASKTFAWEGSQYRQSPRHRNSILFAEVTRLIINLFRVLLSPEMWCRIDCTNVSNEPTASILRFSFYTENRTQLILLKLISIYRTTRCHTER
jgi:hypothetical protein